MSSPRGLGCRPVSGSRDRQSAPGGGRKVDQRAFFALLAAHDVGDQDAEVAGVGRVEQRRWTRDHALAHQLLDLAVEVLHAVHLAVAHRVEQRLALALAALHVVARAQRRLQDLEHGDAAAALLRHQPLRDEVAERRREAAANRALIAGVEGADDALDGLRGVDGVQRREDEVPGLGGGQRDLDRLAIAHLADEDHLRRLAQRGAQGEGEGRRVAVQLALMDGRLLVSVQELDRILDGEDVIGPGLVDQIDDRRERRRLARSGRPGDEHDAVLQRRDVGQRLPAA